MEVQSVVSWLRNSTGRESVPLTNESILLLTIPLAIDDIVNYEDVPPFVESDNVQEVVEELKKIGWQNIPFDRNIERFVSSAESILIDIALRCHDKSSKSTFSSFGFDSFECHLTEEPEDSPKDKEIYRKIRRILFEDRFLIMPVQKGILNYEQMISICICRKIGISVYAFRDTFMSNNFEVGLSFTPSDNGLLRLLISEKNKIEEEFNASLAWSLKQNSVKIIMNKEQEEPVFLAQTIKSFYNVFRPKIFNLFSDGD